MTPGSVVYLLPKAGGPVQPMAWPRYMAMHEDALSLYEQFWTEHEALSAAVMREYLRGQAARCAQSAAA